MPPVHGDGQEGDTSQKQYIQPMLCCMVINARDRNKAGKGGGEGVMEEVWRVLIRVRYTQSI